MTIPWIIQSCQPDSEVREKPVRSSAEQSYSRCPPRGKDGFQRECTVRRKLDKVTFYSVLSPGQLVDIRRLTLLSALIPRSRTASACCLLISIKFRENPVLRLDRGHLRRWAKGRIVLRTDHDFDWLTSI